MICFVILHYQAEDETVNCINHIKEKVVADRHIIIIDNASPNSSGIKLKNKYVDDSEVDILLLDNNLGFAKGNNIGYKKAKEYNPDFIVVMNNDVLLEQYDFVEIVKQVYLRTEFDVMGPDIFSAKTGLHQNPQREKNYTLDELIASHKKLHFKNRYKFLLRIKYSFLRRTVENVVQVTDYTREQLNIPLHGSCYIFSKKFIDIHSNCFYDGTFMYYESYILHYLGQREQLRFVYSPDVKVVHHEDVATDQTFSNLYNKVAFVNMCLEESCKCFIELMKDKTIRIG